MDCIILKGEERDGGNDGRGQLDIRGGDSQIYEKKPFVLWDIIPLGPATKKGRCGIQKCPKYKMCIGQN